MSEERTECIAITQSGTRCKNMAKPGSDYCHTHQTLASTAAASPTDTANSDTDAPNVSSPDEALSADEVADNTIPVTNEPSSSQAKFEILANELNALAAELQRSIPNYRPPTFSIDGLVALLKENLDRFTPDVQIEIVSELKRNLEGTSARDLIDPDTWKGFWYILNYMAQEQSATMRQKLYDRLASLPGMALLSDLKGNLAGTSPKEFLDPDTWKGMWMIMSYSVQATAVDIKRAIVGEDEEDE